MKFTDHFKLGSVEANQPVLPIEDARRMLTIDRQLLGLFQIFGNGVITGWKVTAGSALTVNVSPGRGHINFMAGETRDPRTVIDLVPESVNYIYAQVLDSTRFDRDVLFIGSLTQFNSTQMILLAAVTTGTASILSIDESVRNDISFIETIKTLINQHRHKGGPDNPTKIDLSSEVMGQLPGSRIADIDAGKVTTGVLSPGRLPPLEHSELLHSGVLTHAQLDSFVRNLENDNVRLLGELSATNMLQMYLAMKHIWNEVDAFSTNLLTMIPGITPDSFTDFDATTAVVDKTNHLIQGVPSTNGTVLTTTFSSQADFEGAFASTNLNIAETAALDGYFELERPFSEKIVENYDNVISSGADFPKWKVETVSTADDTTFLSDGTQKVDGPFSADFNVDQGFRVQTTRFFSGTDVTDWTTFNKIEVSIYTLSANHGRLNMQLIGGTQENETILDDFVLSEAGEITQGDFIQTVRLIDGVTRDNVIGIRIYTETGSGWDLQRVNFNIDRIRLINDSFYTPDGRIRFRLNTPQKSQWAAISWDGDNNDGQIRARARSVSDFAVLDGTSAIPFADFFTASGDNPQVADNTCIEIEIALTSSDDKTSSPVVRSVTVSYITPNELKGFSIDTAADFNRGTLVNTKVVATPNTPFPDDGDVVIDGRIEAGDYVYSTNYTVQQIFKDLLTNRVTPYRGISGDRLPLSPVQAARTSLSVKQTGLDGVAHVKRLDNRTYLVCDTLNDRVMVLDPNGNLIKGWASNNARNQKATSVNEVSQGEGLYPLTVVMNLDNDTLYVTWSTNVKFASVVLTGFSINGAGLNVTLNNSDTVQRLVGLNGELETGNVTPIKLSESHVAAIRTFVENSGISDNRIFLNVDPDAVQDGVNLDNLNFASLSTPRGLPVFVGNLKYMRGLFNPISVDVTSAENWLVGNSKPLLLAEDGTDIRTGVSKDEINSVLEIVPDTGEVVFSDDSVDFSLLTLGGAVEFNERFIVVAGITTDDNPPGSTSATNTVTSKLGEGTVSTNNTTTTTTTTTVPASDSSSTSTVLESSQQSEFSQLSNYRGRVKMIEKKSGRVVFDQLTSDGTYASDVQLDPDDNFVVIEKYYLADGTAKGRVVKLDDLGNVFFQWGLSEFLSPNDVRVLENGNMVIAS